MKLFLNAYCKKTSFPIAYLILGSLSFFFALNACTKEKTTNVVSGIIKDEVTGKPLANVLTYWWAQTIYGAYPYFDTCYTDSNGYYSLKLAGYDIYEIIMDIKKPGYVYLEYKIPVGTNLTKNLNLAPYNSYISFNISNDLNKYYYLNGTYWCDIITEQDMSAKINPIPNPPGMHYYETRKIPGGRYFYITWDYANYSTLFGDYPHFDSVYVHQGDSVIYNISM